MTSTSFNQQELLDIAGKVLEAAVRNEQSVEDILSGLNNTILTLNDGTRNLPAMLATQFEKQVQEATEKAANTIVQKFVAANVNAEMASAAFKQAIEAARTKIIVPTLSITAIGTLALMGMALYFTPPVDEILNRRQQLDSIMVQIPRAELLNKAELKSCYNAKGELRLCAKMDTHLPSNSDGYRFILEKH